MFQIISDGSCDLSAADKEQLEVFVIPCYITFDEINYLKEGIDIQRDEYFEKLKTEKELHPKTSQPSPADYLDAYTPFLREGKDLLVVTMASKISGSNNSARIAAEMAMDDFPERKIEIVDSINATLGQGLLVREIVRMRENGLYVEQAADKARKVALTTKQYFTIDSLEFLKRGGRISSTKAIVGGVLGIKPILEIKDGEVAQLDKVRGNAKAMKFLEDKFLEDLQALNKSDISVGVAHILMEEEAVELDKKASEFLERPLDYDISFVGATIGTHTGPGAITIAYCTKYEKV